MTDKSSSCSSHCQPPLPELKLYQAFIFSIPILFTLVLLLLFYMLYLRRRRNAWAAAHMMVQYEARGFTSEPTEFGLKKEFRDMLPTVVFNENVLIEDTQCAVCLGDYQINEKLQQLPVCGHTFHMECIDKWLANNTTCPLCRTSLLQAAKVVPLDSPAHIATPLQIDELPQVSFAQQVHPIQDMPSEESPQREEESSSIDDRFSEEINTTCLDMHEAHIYVTDPQEVHSTGNADAFICAVC